MRTIIKYEAMLLALCVNFGHIEAMNKAYWEEWAELSSLPPNEEYNPLCYNQILNQERRIWWENFLMSLPEYVRNKIIGIPQYTGDCHASAIAYLAKKLAEDENVEKVYLNKSLSVATNYEIISLLRPDITTKLYTGSYGLIEIMSASETYDSQRNKILQKYHKWSNNIDLNYSDVFDAKDFIKISPVRRTIYYHPPKKSSYATRLNFNF